VKGPLSLYIRLAVNPVTNKIYVALIQWQPTPRRRLSLSFCFGIVALAAALTGCGGSSYTAPPTPPYTGTTKGTATITVTGTAGNTTISTVVNLTVQ
jgi:hypothetical protein